MHAGVAGVARVNRVCHTHSWRVDRALGQGVARVAVEARRGGGRRFALALSVSYSPDLAYLKVLRLQAWGACTTLRPSRKGYGFDSPVTGAEQKPRPLLVRGFFVCAAHCTLYGGPCGDTRKGVPVLSRSANPARSAASSLAGRDGRFSNLLTGAHHGYNPGESHLPPHS